MRFITFLSDYGTSDEFVGVCHGVIASIAPECRVIDIGHGASGVRSGAAMLAQAVPFMPRAIHLAIVDPGVGTSRRGIVVSAVRGSLLVGPDNGLLIDAADTLGGPAAAWELSAERFRLRELSATFHGRDVFAPAAAHLASGLDAHELGPPLDPRGLVRLPSPRVEVSDGSLGADVLRHDSFGNIQLAARAEHLVRAGLGLHVVVEAGGTSREAVVGRTFADAAAGELVVYLDAAHHVATAVNRGRACDVLRRPEWVRIRRP